MTVYILGGFQTDFAQHAARHDEGLFELMRAALLGALDDAGVGPELLEAAHVGNFTGELFCRQGQLGGLLVSIDPELAGLPTARHEAACASGSVALLAATAEIEAGRYDVVAVVGVEQMRNVSGREAADHLGVAAWADREAVDATFLWPAMFSDIAAAYRQRHGLPHEVLAELAKKAFDNARRNPNAHARAWRFEDAAFGQDDSLNPIIEGSLRKQDCGRISDGAAAVVLCSERFRAAHGRDRLPYIAGWGHRTAPMLLAEKLRASERYVFPHLRATLEDAWRRAELADASAIDCFEVHDCFTVTEYMVVDHLGLAAPGEAKRLVLDGALRLGGRHPVNPSGGLIGGGHPVGATGVRMLLDASKQVTETAGDYQVDGARWAQTLNLGGSATTTVSFVVTR